jgi:hypothetical protein
MSSIDLEPAGVVELVGAAVEEVCGIGTAAAAIGVTQRSSARRYAVLDTAIGMAYPPAVAWRAPASSKSRELCGARRVVMSAGPVRFSHGHMRASTALLDNR